MKIFIDSADIKEIREVAGWGILGGCTTNPSLVSKTGRPFRDCVQDILKVVDGPVSVEAVSTDAAGMVKEGQDWARLDQAKVTIKIPMCIEGLKAVSALSEQEIKTNVTLVFAQPGPARRARRRDLREPVRGPAGRYLARRDGADP